MEWRLPSIAMLGVLAVAPAIAAEPGSSFAEFTYQMPQHGTYGGGIHGSALLGSRVVLDIGLDGWEHRSGGVGLASLGLGARWLLQGSTSLVAGISAEGVVGEFGPDDEAGSMSGAASGVGANLQLSHRITDKLEVLGRIKVTTMNDSSRVFMFGVRSYLWKRVALAVDVSDDEFGTRFGLGLRLDLSRATQ